ncbi:MAG: hypothetical protein H0U77_15040 [Nocardioidaceae bacterium]|nr:hypothetical protein [Nocardioidaceae bacterium]
MNDVRGLLGLAVCCSAVAAVFSVDRRALSVRTVLAALAVQAVFAALVLRWEPGEGALSWVSDRVSTLIGYAEEGTTFVFGPLTGVGAQDQTIFALQVLPVIVLSGPWSGYLASPSTPPSSSGCDREGPEHQHLANLANAAIAGVVVSV